MHLTSALVFFNAMICPHGALVRPRTNYPTLGDLNDMLPESSNFSCSPLAQGLSLDDCNYMASIGMFGQGKNPLANNGRIWIGTDGPNTFTFINGGGGSLTLVMWYADLNDDQASFMNVRQPEISYSLPNTGSAVEVSVGNGVPGGWTVLYDHVTELNQYGQISNTFGEFSSGSWATVDVSRLVNMSGDPMTIRVYTGEPATTKGLKPVCVSDLNTCAYACRVYGENSCGETGSYDLIGCGGPNAVKSTDLHGNPNGGCQGWSFGGHIEVVIT
ncbi:hypothetical protein QBC38DRAFT_462401 [Podospora fimiseda]|uniref:Uncharacterized protein n=1 Tax=Podospora fimiseda TaxID=252190 RepID=A0AAN7BGA7_9PEZI|nr:hypothetical protein QBC38DRAFT_462401 [Podospora fimiseda]